MEDIYNKANSEQLGTVEAMIEGATNPLSYAGKAFAREIGEMNTRGGTWKQADYLKKTIKKPTTGKTIKKNPLQGTIFDQSDKTGAIKIGFGKVTDEGKVYHTSSNKLGDLNDDKILWTTKDQEYSKVYGREGSRNTYEFSTKGLNILDGYSKEGVSILEKINKSLPKNKQFTSGIRNNDGGVSSFFIQDKNVIQKLRQLGYDAVETSEFNKGGTKSIGIINPSKLKKIK